MTTTIRLPAVAGSFYPGDPEELAAAVRQYLAPALEQSPGPTPKALIAPHAGYIYSGPVAASAYAQVWPLRGHIQRVALLGPAHRVPFRGLALSHATAFATPLGRIPLDFDMIRRLCELPQVGYLDAAHLSEHSLEVHLPFLQIVLGELSLVPIVVGDADAEEVAQVIETLWAEPGTLVVVSSDLSHYHDYPTACRMDAATSRAIEALRPEDIDYEQACGRVPVAGLLLAARHCGLHARTVDLRNSGDTAGSRDRVVGYGAYVLS
jgi:MEMO1 family protein